MAETRRFNTDGSLRELRVDTRGEIPPTRDPEVIPPDTTYTVHTFTYYRTGEIDIIETEVFDNADSRVSRRRLKHYLDGRQPVTL